MKAFFNIVDLTLGPILGVPKGSTFKKEIYWENKKKFYLKKYNAIM